jgi:biopolymer transport protein ExbD
MSIHKPGRRLMHEVPLKFVQKKVTGGGHRSVAAALNLTSMIDYLVTVVIFLLMSFSASGEVPTSKTVTLPMAENTLDMVTAPMVAINGQQILVNEHPVGSTRAIEEAGRVLPRIDELFAALKTLKDDWKKLYPDKKEFPGIVILQVDKEVSALVVKSVFQTAASAGYPNVSFMVGKLAEKKELPGLPARYPPPDRWLRPAVVSFCGPTTPPRRPTPRRVARRAVRGARQW